MLKYSYRSAFARGVCCVLLLGLMMTMMPPVASTAAAYEDVYGLPVLTGNKAADVANIALSQLGYAETGGATAYGVWWTGETGTGYDFTYSDWCAMFACWCANKAGAGNGYAYDINSASSSSLLAWLRQNAWVDSSYATAPRAGDFIFFGYGTSARHVAVVTGYDADTNTVTFVGGNQSDSVTLSTIAWSTSGRYGDQSIVAYGRPNYGGKVSVPTKPSVAVERGVYIGGADVKASWKKVAGSAYYSVNVYRDGELVTKDSMVDLSSYTIRATGAGEYTVRVSAANSAGSSAAGSCSFTVVDTLPNASVWVAESTVAAAELNAKLQIIEQGILRYATWYTQTQWYTYLQAQNS